MSLAIVWGVDWSEGLTIVKPEMICKHLKRYSVRWTEGVMLQEIVLSLKVEFSFVDQLGETGTSTMFRGRTLGYESQFWALNSLVALCK